MKKWENNRKFVTVVFYHQLFLIVLPSNVSLCQRHSHDVVTLALWFLRSIDDAKSLEDKKANFPKRTSNFTKQPQHISTSATDVQFWWMYDVFDVFLWLPYLFLFFPSGWDIQNPGKHRQVLASKFASNSGQFFSGLRIRQNRWKNFTWPLGR